MKLVLAGVLAFATACSVYFGDDDGSDDPGAPPDPARADAAVATDGPDGDEPLCGRPAPGSIKDEIDCDPVAQTGCTGGERCTITVFGVPGCVPNGTTNIGRACDTAENDTCIAGTFCATDTFEATEGTCQQFCIPSNADCGCGKSCAFQSPFETYDFGLCMTPCDLLRQNCTESRGCYIDSYGNTSCIEVFRGGGQGESCSLLFHCDPGFGCFGGQCAAFCDMAAETPCATDHVCTPLSGAEPNVGICQ